MKNKLILSLLIACGVLFSTNAQAQGDQGEQVFTLDAGFSVTGGLIKAVFDDNPTFDSTGTLVPGGSSVSGGPAIVLGWDMGLSERWSIGAIVTTQGWSGDAANSFINSDGNWVDETVNFKLRRNNVSICPKIHYGNGDNVDLYSGLRVGYVFWNSSIESNDPAYNLLEDFASGGRVNFGLTLFGGRFYVNDNLGLNFELNMGAPFLFGAGLNWKLT
ncbi:MAG: hypothetical protein JJ975_13145 [Bacteroidia bacterium]|nr:hypothetical protein [Bacteroidia bacterium]